MLQSKEQIGRLDQRVIIQQAIIGVDASNEDKEMGWESIPSVPNPWSSVEEKGGSENYQGDILTAVTIAVFTMRHRTDLNEKMRILYNDRIYGIKSIIFHARKGYIKVTAESGGQYVET